MDFDKESLSEQNKKIRMRVGSGSGELWGGGGGGNTGTKTVSQTVKRGKIQNINHLHNVKHVVQSTLQNM